MSLDFDVVSETTEGVSIVDGPEALDVVLQPDHCAAIWRRQTPLETQFWLDDLEPSVLPKGRVVLPVDAVPDAVNQLFDMSGVPQCENRDWLMQDITTLAQVYATLMDTKTVRLRLDVITTNACRKFHIDAVTSRLVCTYRGTGTQYGVSRGGDDPHRVFTVATGAPILLRGTLWPPNLPFDILHRSPPIEGTGETRLVLVLDPVMDAEDYAARRH